MCNRYRELALPLLTLCLVLLSCSGGSSEDSASDAGNSGVCHNGTLSPGEQCDNSVADSTTCKTLGFADGDLSCNNNCQFDTSNCTRLETCGNGALDTLEVCEGFELRDASCATHGFEGGSLSCTSDCTIDTSDCVLEQQSSCDGDVPDATGEFFLAIAPSIAPAAFLQFIGTVQVDSSSVPATFAMTLQPLCTQSDQCSIGQPIGAPYAIGATEINEQCGFSMNLSAIDIPGGANTISGSALVGDLTAIGDLQTEDFYCGVVNGTVETGGAPISIDNSAFGSIRIVPGTLGGNLPAPVSACP